MSAFQNYVFTPALLDEVLEVVFEKWSNRLVEGITHNVPGTNFVIEIKSLRSLGDFYVAVHNKSTGSYVEIYAQPYCTQEIPAQRILGYDVIYAFEVSSIVQNEFTILEQLGDCKMITINTKDLTEEKYFQYNTLFDIQLSIDEINFINGKNCLGTDCSASVRFKTTRSDDVNFVIHTPRVNEYDVLLQVLYDELNGWEFNE